MSMRKSSLSTSRHDPHDHVTIHYTGQPTYHNNVNTLPDIPESSYLLRKRLFSDKVIHKLRQKRHFFSFPKTVWKINTKGAGRSNSWLQTKSSYKLIIAVPQKMKSLHRFLPDSARTLKHLVQVVGHFIENRMSPALLLWKWNDFVVIPADKLACMLKYFAHKWI